MKVIQTTHKTINETRCDWIKEQAMEIKALLQYDDNIVKINKQRALSDIETAIQSLNELKEYINQL